MSLFALLLSFTFATAQTSTQVTIGMDAIGLASDLDAPAAAAGLTIGIESAMSKRFTISVERTMAKATLLDVHSLALKQKINAISTGLRFYPKAANRGFFLGLSLGYTSVKYRLDSELLPELSAIIGGLPTSYVGGGMDMGFKAKISKRLTLGTHLGLKVMPRMDFETAALQYNIGAKLGYNF